MRDETKDWIKQALKDLEAAKALLNSEIYYASAFFSQQAAEKALKALAIELGLIPLGHSLLRILNMISDEIEVPEEIFKASRKLTPLYTLTRYPDSANAPPAEIFDEKDAEEALKAADKVLEWVLKNVEGKAP